MARKPRIEKNGFYHVLNRGVARSFIFKNEQDYLKFLEILQEASQDYDFEIYSYCLMGNHYHLLIKIKKENLSTIMQKVNSRYSIYFNHKYKRVGPLWQGRFKSWFVYDEVYLKTLVRYIEFNPIKAKIVNEIGIYRWSMSSCNFKLSMLNFELIDITDFDTKFNNNEEMRVEELFKSKFKIEENKTIKKIELKSIGSYFELNEDRELAIYLAVIDGYTQSDIAKHLNLSNVAISKILKIYKQKVTLFNKLKNKGIFWSYSKDITYKEIGDRLFIEYLLKYGDFYDIALGFRLFGKRQIKKVWEEILVGDQRFIKLNLMIARVFLDMSVESDYFKGVKNARFEKFKLLAS